MWRCQVRAASEVAPFSVALFRLGRHVRGAVYVAFIRGVRLFAPSPLRNPRFPFARNYSDDVREAWGSRTPALVNDEQSVASCKADRGARQGDTDAGAGGDRREGQRA